MISSLLQDSRGAEPLKGNPIHATLFNSQFWLYDQSGGKPIDFSRGMDDGHLELCDACWLSQFGSEVDNAKPWSRLKLNILSIEVVHDE